MALIDATFDLIADNGVASITIANVCERVGLKRSSFYTHFKDFAELLNHVSMSILSDIGHRSNAAFGNEAQASNRLYDRAKFVLDTGRSRVSWRQP